MTSQYYNIRLVRPTLNNASDYRTNGLTDWVRVSGPIASVSPIVRCIIKCTPIHTLSSYTLPRPVVGWGRGHPLPKLFLTTQLFQRHGASILRPPHMARSLDLSDSCVRGRLLLAALLPYTRYRGLLKMSGVLPPKLHRCIEIRTAA